MNKVVIFSSDDYKAMVSLMKDSLIEVNSLEESYFKNQIHNKLTEVLTILTKEEE